MAEFPIDQNKLPGVKEVCRDFAVLEDHCLAHNLQEQEIESHLASNVHKSRLVQQDVALAKQLQEEEDRRAQAKAKRQHRDIERSDNEIAQEIQEELVRQAEQQRKQEEKDAAIARKLQEKEMKEERKRQKQLEANFEEEYYEDKGGRIVQGGPGGRGAVVVGGEYGMGEATQGIAQLDLREQEILDMEVARKLQEEEVKASKMDKRAAQVAQDEEIARLLMEQEKKEYKKSREKEKQGMRPEERGMRPEERGMRLEERRRPEGGDCKPNSEEVVRPRSREEEYQRHRNHQKPARPPQPLPHDYENVETSYSYSESHYSSRTPARPEAAYKGTYYRQ
ncbi:coiled-coil domain-containing protein 50-like isoform X3 [Oncorhynchus nerka]|uniref:coiled-coil domain-containing protein 50-like isoform X3 n=1 Tax=Oncorhynchus nerka TaxID=8023 RepID=UPI0011323038|nr:coiled-coil domain-containing protein 50-like isoform X3 [Oncorhynchus nerka]